MRRAHAKAGPSSPWRRPVAAALSLAALAGAGDARAQRAPNLPPQPGAAISAPTPAPPTHRLLFRSTTLARYNPLGLFGEARFGYRRRLFESESALLRDTFAGVGLAGTLSPAITSISPSLEFQPLSVFQLTASYSASLFFGGFGHLQSYPSAASPHSDDDRDAGEEAGRAYRTTRGQFTVQPLVQVKVGPVAARSATRFIYNLSDLRRGDRVSYDPVADLLVPRDGWVIANDSDLVAVTPFGLTAGLRYSMARAIYDDDDFAPGEDPRSPASRTIQRIGPLVSYTFFDRPGAGFNTPTVFVLAQWWLDHHYRAGQDSSQAVPYLIVGFSFSGDLL
ncbi:MAG TPA: hypothetical protein VFS43_41660 [Polyangiaceae bacterium]|nr:hypothetical protein [Polyangiaceae bacterium]